MDLLNPLLILIVLISGGAALALVRRRIIGDAPMVALVGVIFALGAGGLLVSGPVGVVCGLGAIFLALALELSSALVEPLAQLATIQGRRRRAFGLSALFYLVRPTYKNWTALVVARTVWRVDSGRLSGPEALASLKARLERLGALRALRRMVWVLSMEGSVLEGITAVRAVRGHWQELNIAFDSQPHQFHSYLSRRPSGASVDVVSALCELGRIQDAARLLGEMNRADRDDMRSNDERSDAYLNKARAVLLAHLGQRPLLDEIFLRESSLRGLFSAARRAALLEKSEDVPSLFSEEVGAVLKESSDALLREARLATRLSSISSPGPVTVVLICLLAVAYLFETLSGDTLDASHLVESGGHLGSAVREGQWWRLVTGTFLHAGIVHFGLNALFLLLFGNMLERMVGPWRFCLVYIFAGLAGASSAVFFGAEGVGVGASGAIFGVFGACIPALVRLKADVPRRYFFRQMSFVVGVLVINTYLGVALEFISFSAHTGGLLCGALVLVLLFACEKVWGLAALQRWGPRITACVWILALSYGLGGLVFDHVRPVTERPSRAYELEVETKTDDGASRGRLLLQVPAWWIEKREDDPRLGLMIGAQGNLAQAKVHCGSTLQSIKEDRLMALKSRDPEALAKVFPDRCEPGPEGFFVCETESLWGEALVGLRLDREGLVGLSFVLSPGRRDEGRALFLKMLSSAELLSCQSSDGDAQGAGFGPDH